MSQEPQEKLWEREKDGRFAHRASASPSSLLVTVPVTTTDALHCASADAIAVPSGSGQSSAQDPPSGSSALQPVV